MAAAGGRQIDGACPALAADADWSPDDIGLRALHGEIDLGRNIGQPS
jgi:hypothetical protein